MTHGFNRFNLSQNTLAALAKMGFEEPTPIQVEALPLVLQGEDVIAQARTGTGKTAAFGIPLVEATRGKHVQQLVLAPTRELANQITAELNEIGHGSPFSAFAVYGGVGFGKQRSALGRNGKTTCVVACPGRLLDLIERGWIDLSRVEVVVLDEADRMLDMGFIRDIRKILQHVPRERQTLLFSATVPQEIRELARQYMRNPETVQAESGPLATPLTDQFHITVQGEGLAHLLTLLDKEDPERAVVFTGTKHTAKRIGEKLRAAGYRADALQGNMSQSKRDTAMAEFRTGKVRILVATDVAARGIDVDELTHVIQFDMPQKPEDYVHRTGRTGRAGREGRAFLFVPHDDQRTVTRIEKLSGIPIKPYDLGQLRRVPDNVKMAGPRARNYESVVAGGRSRGAGGKRGGPPKHVRRSGGGRQKRGRPRYHNARRN